MALSEDKRTLTYDEVYNAWTSFHAYTPEWIERLGGNLYSFKDGELYEHDANEVRSNFYGQNYGCSVTYSSNKGPSDVKLFKTISLESNSNQWYATISSELESGRIGSSGNIKFQGKEGFRYAYIRRNAGDELDFNKLSVIGIGNLQSSPGTNQYKFSKKIPNQITANNTDGNGGDKLYFNNGTSRIIGIIDSISNDTITTVSSDNTPSVSDFCFIAKNSEAESFGVRGYHAKVTLTSDSTSALELYGANSEVFKSYM